jgi:hypothetical protein
MLLEIKCLDLLTITVFGVGQYSIYFECQDAILLLRTLEASGTGLSFTMSHAGQELKITNHRIQC